MVQWNVPSQNPSSMLENSEENWHFPTTRKQLGDTPSPLKLGDPLPPDTLAGFRRDQRTIDQIINMTDDIDLGFEACEMARVVLVE